VFTCSEWTAGRAVRTCKFGVSCSAPSLQSVTRDLMRFPLRGRRWLASEPCHYDPLRRVPNFHALHFPSSPHVDN
jgi:hypothetical protein